MSENLGKGFYERIDEEVKYICDGGYTLREVAKLMGVSKSTVHVDVTKRLEKHSRVKYLLVKEELESHLAVWHLKGGEATKRRYQRLKK